MPKNNGKTDWWEIIATAVVSSAITGLLGINEKNKRIQQQQQYINYLETRITALDQRVNQLQFNYQINLNQLNQQIQSLTNEVNALKQQLNDPNSLQRLEQVLIRLQEIKRRRLAELR